MATSIVIQNKVLSQNLSHNFKIKKTRELEKAGIEKLLFSYRDALNASDVSKVLTLYTEVGVFMPTNAPTAEGQEWLKGSYEFVFNTSSTEH